MERSELLTAIDAAFTAPYPGDPWLQGSFDGCEPSEEIGAFVGRTDWRDLDAAFLDVHSAAISFFSEAGLRFFLPAYLCADVRDELMTADPLFGLVHGFSEFGYDAPGEGIAHRSGGSVLLNPRRYGAMTWQDASRHRLSVFCREEATVIVQYLHHRRERDQLGLDTPSINAALESFWALRATSAPTRAELDGFTR